MAALKKINPDLEKAIKDMLKEVTKKGADITLKDKLSVIDRALKLEAIRAKLDDQDWGAGLTDDE